MMDKLNILRNILDEFDDFASIYDEFEMQSYSIDDLYLLIDVDYTVVAKILSQHFKRNILNLNYILKGKNNER